MRETPRARLVLTVLVLTAFTLITLDYRAGNGSPFEHVRRSADAVLGPIEGAVSAAVRPVADALSRLTGGGGGAKIRQLEKENADLRAQVERGAADQQRLTDLEKLTGLAGAGRLRIVAANVVGIGGSGGFEWTATIDVGSRDGVQPLMSVVSGDGLVGRVKTVGPRTSTVLLAMDPQSQVGARVATTGFVGWVRGGGSGPMTFTLLDAHATLKKGQQLVTFGSENDRPYIPEIPIGTITKVESTPGAQTRTALVEPFTQFTALDPVAVVISAPRDIPRDSLLPTPPPKPAPTPTAPASPLPGTPTPSGSPSAAAVATKPGG